MFILTLKSEFSAAHRLVNYPGVCSNIHGHNWKVEIKVATDELDESGMAIDLTLLQDKLQKVILPFDHQTINKIEPFDKLNPTSENISYYFFQQFKKELPNEIRLVELTVKESDTFSATYSQEYDI